MVDVLVSATHAAVIVAIGFQFYRKQDLLRAFYWPALIFKLVSGVCLGMLYTHYYSVADTFTYFHDASRLAGLAGMDLSLYLRSLFGETVLASGPFDPRALFMTRIASVFCLLTANNYWAIGFYFSFFSFLGAWFLVRAIGRNIPAVVIPAVVAFLFLPSAVFWTSGLLKESLAMGSLFFLAGIFLKLWFRERITASDIAVTALALWVLWNLKYYYAGVFVAVVATTFVCRLLLRRKSFPFALEASAWLIIFILPVALVSVLHPNFYYHRLFQVIVDNNAAYNILSSPGDVIHYSDLQPTALSILANSPQALFSGLFRPFVWEASTLLQLLAGLENALLLLVFAVCLRSKTSLQTSNRLLVVAVVVFVIVMSVMLSLAAPNFGTLSRYRSGYISFFTFIVLCNNPLMQYVERSFTRLVRKSSSV